MKSSTSDSVNCSSEVSLDRPIRSIRLLQMDRVGLGTNDLVLVYCTIVRSIVEYASPVWAAISLYLDELIESVQRKALKIIFGRVDYTEALVLAGLESLSDRRVGACKRFMATARQMSPLKNIICSY